MWTLSYTYITHGTELCKLAMLYVLYIIYILVLEYHSSKVLVIISITCMYECVYMHMWSKQVTSLNKYSRYAWWIQVKLHTGQNHSHSLRAEREWERARESYNLCSSRCIFQVCDWMNASYKRMIICLILSDKCKFWQC